MPKKTDIAIFDSLDKNYAQLLELIKSRVISTRIKISKAACHEQITLYWWFGQQIVKAQEKHGWGKSVIEQLSSDLKKIFVGTTAGFSPQNLWYMRQFYMEYKDHPNLQQLVGEIAWGQNLLIMNYYLNLLDDLVKEKNENPSIGITITLALCFQHPQFDLRHHFFLFPVDQFG